MPGDSTSASLSQQPDLADYQRQAMLGSLSAMVAHEFNNLMTPVLARAQDALLRNDVADMRKALACTVGQTQRAMEITRRLLALADGRQAPRETCRVAEAAADALAAMARPLEKDAIEYRADIPEDLAVQAQPVLFVQVLLNLLLNARQAMQERGGRLTLRARREGDEVVIEVIDSGIGIAPQRIEREINPFLAADPQEQPCDWQRIGLGLNVCRMIAQHHKARLEAFPNPGPGVTFRLRWPMP